MRYEVEKLIDQLVEALSLEPDFAGWTVRETAGEITTGRFMNEQDMEYLRNLAQFILVRFEGAGESLHSQVHQSSVDAVSVSVFVGAKYLESEDKGYRRCFPVIRKLYDLMYGKWAQGNYARDASLATIGSQAMDTTEFRPMTPYRYAPGRSVRLVVDVPGLKVYQLSYEVNLLC